MDDDLVYNALRRKLAAAKAAGDLERINTIRAIMSVSEEAAPEAELKAREFSTPWIDAISAVRNEVEPIDPDPWHATDPDITYPDTDE